MCVTYLQVKAVGAPGCERERERKGGRERVRESERESVCVRVMYVQVKAVGRPGCVHVCVCGREKAREGERECVCVSRSGMSRQSARQVL